MSGLRKYLIIVLALVLSCAALIRSAQASQACYAPSAIFGACPSCDVINDSVCATCSVCIGLQSKTVGSLAGVAASPRVQVASLDEILNAPHRARLRPPRRLAWRPFPAWALPPNPALASLNIDLPPPHNSL
jgi:hypothetical protein